MQPPYGGAGEFRKFFEQSSWQNHPCCRAPGNDATDFEQKDLRVGQNTIVEIQAASETQIWLDDTIADDLYGIRAWPSSGCLRTQVLIFR